MQHDYFELFGITPRFDIDINLLRDTQRQLQTQYHPDKHINADSITKSRSIQQAANVNEGFEVLSNPVKRARYMLQRSGIELNDESETTSDVSFLMEQIEHRESMDACRQANDPLLACDELIKKLKIRLNGLGQLFVENFNSNDMNAAKETSRKMQFVDRVLHQATELQYEIEEEFS